MSYNQINENAQAKLFIFWTGTNPMSPNRLKSTQQMESVTGLPTILVTPENLDEWILHDHPLHPAYEHLSLTHKADYLRTYFMHHHGGAYADVKLQTGSWVESLDKLNADPNILAIGYNEVPGGMAVPELASEWRVCIGNGAYICKPRTLFTQKWYNQMLILLDSKLERLILHPATDPRDQRGIWLHSKQKHSEYPLEWNEMLGRIFHKVMYEYRSQILQGLPTPKFWDYQ